MDDNHTLTINFDIRCAECGKAGATPSGICLKCVNKALSDRPMKSKQGQVVQERYRKILGELK